MSNTLTGKTVTVVYNTLTTDLSCLASIPVAYWACPLATTTYIDITTLASIANKDTAINTAVTDGTQDYVICLTEISSAGTAAGVIGYATAGTLWKKLKVANRGDQVITGTSAGGGTSSTTHLVITGDTCGADDYYNGLMLYITAGGTTGLNIGMARKIIDSDTSDTDVTIGGAAAAEAFDDETFYIYDTQDYLWIVRDITYVDTGATAFGYYTAKNALTRGCYKLWELIHPNNDMPLMLNYIGNYLFDEYHSTSDNAAATTLVLTTAGWTINAYAGMYVYTYSGTGENQWAQIVSNDATTLTCRYFNGDYGKLAYRGKVEEVGGNAAWTTNPTSTAFRIVAQYTDILMPEYMQMYIRNVLNLGLSGADLLINGQKLVDMDNKVSDYTYGAPVQDLEFLMECLEYGKAAYESSIVTAITTLV
jgi:hypothetical protein